MGRKALPEVLTAITERLIGHWRAEVRSPAWRGLSQIDATRRLPPRVRWKVEVDFARKTTRERTALLTVESPAHGVEKLNEAGLWPWAPGDVDAPRWFCERCAREGWVTSAPVACVCDRSDDTPPSLAALVAVASLGTETLLRVVQLARELHAVTRGETGASLVWRVMTREALREHHARLRAKLLDTSDTVAQAFSTEENLRVYGETEHNRALAWRVPHPYERDAVEAAYPILRALAVHEDGKTPTGLHLVDADRARVVIAVEAL